MPRSRLRPRSRDPSTDSRPYARIRELKCFPEVHQRIVDGWPVKEIARYITQVKQEATGIPIASLEHSLAGYRDSLPPAVLVQKRIPQVMMEAAKELEDGLDELRELEKLYLLQMKRIKIDWINEQKIKKLLPTTAQEIRTAREILSTYANLKMDLGLSKRHLGQVDVDAKLIHDVAGRYNKPEVQAVLSNPQSRKKVLSLFERFMSKSGMQLANVPPDPDTIDVPGEVTEDESAREIALEMDDPLAGPIPVSSEEDVPPEEDSP